MKTFTELTCPHGNSSNIVRNGKKSNHIQHYLCKSCGKQFINNTERTYRDTFSYITNVIKMLVVRGMGIRDISIVLQISIEKVLQTLRISTYQIIPAKPHYDCREIDEFWTYVGKKQHKHWLIYAYHRKTGEIVAYVWGKRDLKTAKKLRRRLQQLGVTYDWVAMDSGESFLSAFREDKRLVGKKYTKGIEEDNCRLRHRIRRAFRKTCCFSKSLINHLKGFDMTFFYINYGHI